MTPEERLERVLRKIDCDNVEKGGRLSFSFKQNSRATLCENCAHSTVAKSSSGRLNINCGEFSYRTQPEQPVVECNSYTFKWSEPTWDMKHLAWDITLDPKTKAGFKVTSPVDREKK